MGYMRSLNGPSEWIQVWLVFKSEYLKQTRKVYCLDSFEFILFARSISRFTTKCMQGEMWNKTCIINPKKGEEKEILNKWDKRTEQGDRFKCKCIR